MWLGKWHYVLGGVVPCWANGTILLSDWFLVFRHTVVPSSTGLSSLLGLPDPEDKITISQKTWFLDLLFLCVS